MPDAIAWRGLALTQLAEGQVGAYRQTCAAMLRRFGGSPWLARVALPFVGTPQNVLGGGVLAGSAERVRFQQEHDRAVMLRTCLVQAGAADPTALLPLLAPHDEVLRGAALFRAGRHAEAAQLLAGIKAWAGQEPLALLYRALAEQAQGRTPEAQHALKAAVEWMTDQAVDVQAESKRSRLQVLPWAERLELELLRREVEERLAPKKAKPGR
jgi:hypothetical protein